MRNWRRVVECETADADYKVICERVRGSRTKINKNKFREAFADIEFNLRNVLNADVPGVTWHRNKIYFQIFLGDYFHNSQHSRNYVSIRPSLFKAAHSDDIKDFSP